MTHTACKRARAGPGGREKEGPLGVCTGVPALSSPSPTHRVAYTDRNVCSHSWDRPKPYQQDHTPSDGSRGGPFPPVLAAVAASLPLCLGLHVASVCVHLGIPLSPPASKLPFPRKDTRQWTHSHANPARTHLHSITSPKTLTPSKVTSAGSGGRGSVGPRLRHRGSDGWVNRSR